MFLRLSFTARTMATAVDIKKLEADLWEAADNLRANSKLNSSQYCMPVLGLLFLRYAYGRYKLVEAEFLHESSHIQGRGRHRTLTADDYLARSALFLPREAQYDYLINLPEDVAAAHLLSLDGRPLNSLGEVLNNAMALVEAQSAQLAGVLPRSYTDLPDTLLASLLRTFNNDALSDVGGDVMGRIYEYFLNKFARSIAQDDGVFFTPKSLVKMIVNVLEPTRGTLLDPAAGSGGMFIQTGDFVNLAGMQANAAMTFFGQEKVEYNAKLCLMNLAVHGLNGKIASGDGANSFYHDAHGLVGQCDYVMANPPFNVDKVKAATTSAAGRLPFGLPAVNKNEEVSNANYLWISYFYAYLNVRGRAGFVMPASATDSGSRDRDIRQQLVQTGHVDCLLSVATNFFYTKSLPCTLWFLNKGKPAELQDRVLFIDARNYYTVVDRTLNEWSPRQLQNLNAIVWLYRGETEKYRALLADYRAALGVAEGGFAELCQQLEDELKALQEQAVAALQAAPKKGRKKLQAEWDERQAAARERLTHAQDADWLYSKFGEGEYADVPGLCKVATLEEIAARDYSLTPGAYVGVPPMEDDGVDFATRMREIHAELERLHGEAAHLMLSINQNFIKLGL